MDEEEILLNDRYIIAMWALERFRTVDEVVSFWRTYKLPWRECPDAERISPERNW